MTISVRTGTGLAASNTTTAGAWTLPTGHTTGDLLLAFNGGKPYNNNLTTLSGYTLVDNISSGTTTAGNGNGSTYATIFQKTHSGSESAPSGTHGATANPSMSAMLALYNDTSSSWGLAVTDGSQEVNSTAVSVTANSTVDLQAGDMLVTMVVHRDDDATHTSPTVTASGITFGTLTEQLPTNVTTTGADGAMYVYTATVSSGSGTVAPTFAATTANSEGLGVSVIFLRVREQGTTEKSSSDSLTISLTESGSVQITQDGKSSSDSFAISLTEDTNTAVGKSGSDTLAPTLTESPSIAGTVVNTDAVTAPLTESASIASTLSASDSFTTTLTESGALLITKSGSDSFAITLTETTTRTIGVSGSDDITTSLSESATATIALSSSDSVSASLTESNSLDIPGVVNYVDAVVRDTTLTSGSDISTKVLSTKIKMKSRFPGDTSRVYSFKVRAIEKPSTNRLSSGPSTFVIINANVIMDYRVRPQLFHRNTSGLYVVGGDGPVTLEGVLPFRTIAFFAMPFATTTRLFTVGTASSTATYQAGTDQWDIAFSNIANAYVYGSAITTGTDVDIPFPLLFVYTHTSDLGAAGTISFGNDGTTAAVNSMMFNHVMLFPKALTATEVGNLYKRFYSQSTLVVSDTFGVNSSDNVVQSSQIWSYVA